jgi:ABC-type nitrate/sulfonate/bicarbonate transport system ATPase subunit
MQALARALYSQKKIALLDDVFSQLDMRTRITLLRRLLGPNGLFRVMGTTVVVAMSSGTVLLNDRLFSTLNYNRTRSLARGPSNSFGWSRWIEPARYA